MTTFPALFLGLAAIAVCFVLGGRLLTILDAKWREERTAHQQQMERIGMLDERRVVVEERRVAVEERAKAPPPKPEPMPSDLRGRIAMFDEDWAREDEERTLMSLYAELGDWDAVRKQVRPLAPVVESDDLIFARAPEFVR